MSLPLADLRAVVIAARGVTLTAGAMAALLENGAILLHCNEQYQPCGMTCPLTRVVDHAAFKGQHAARAALQNRIWHVLLRTKITNQVRCLARLGRSCPRLLRYQASARIVEGDAARHYWRQFFPALGWSGTGRQQKDADPPNACLNYGYAVLAALCHRSLLLHGLNPQLGVHHRPRYRAEPLVYDFMEPFRPFVDALLAEHYLETPVPPMRNWAKRVGLALRDIRIQRGRNRIKLLDAIDLAASLLARAFAEGTTTGLWLPELPAPPHPLRHE